MSIKDKEHYDLMAHFEKTYKHMRLDREKDKQSWTRGNVYEHGETNELFKAFRNGYSLGITIN